MTPTPNEPDHDWNAAACKWVLRLLAFNAEAWLAEHFNAYLADPNEYRAILRNLLHLGGQIDYTSAAITITLDQAFRFDSGKSGRYASGSVFGGGAPGSGSGGSPRRSSAASTQ